MPIILATWDTEIRKISTADQPSQKRFVKPHLNRKKLSMLAHAIIPATTGSVK
jgi:hypothetical protein